MPSKIEWTDETWNPVTGCTKVSQGCKHCYAERLWPRIEAARIKREGGAPRAFTDVQCHPERLDAPLHWAKPRRVFVNSMSDLFHEDVPDAFIEKVFFLMAHAPLHTFQILTKRPARMQEWTTLNGPDAVFAGESLEHEDALRNYSWPLKNVWLGVSVEDQDTADERIPLLLQTPAAIRFVSYEPALGPVDFNHLSRPPGDADRQMPGFAACQRFTISALHGQNGVEMRDGKRYYSEQNDSATHLDWLIAGGESGPNARPAHPDWFRSARDQCAAAGVPFFFKQWGNWAPSGSGNTFVCELDGSAQQMTPGWHQHCGGSHACVSRIGKKDAGRRLDGIYHDEYPA